MERAFPDGWAPGRPGAEPGPGGAERVLRAAGFAEVASREFQAPCSWSFEAIVGYLKSTSVCSQNALGDDFPAFETELRAALDAPAGHVFQEALRCGYTMGRRPGR
jgi:hypothetical protein